MSKLGPLYLSKHSGVKHTASVIFFHGSGLTGADMRQWVGSVVNNFTFPHINVLYPTSPVQPYTVSRGQLNNIWFDRSAVSPDVPEKLNSIGDIEGEVRYLIKRENDVGISSNRIIVGGFSMGGALAMHTAYRWDHNLAATFAFGSFLCKKSIVYEELNKSSATQLAPLLQIHGDTDQLVFLNWAQDTFNRLKEFGVLGQFHVIKDLGHLIDQQGMILIKEWIQKHLPEEI